MNNSSVNGLALVILVVWQGVAGYLVSRRHALAATSLLLPVPSALATDHRPLEVCLVSVQRVVYWAALQADDLLQQANNGDREVASKIYLEARLGAKAVLTGRLPSSGSTRRVYSLTSLQLTACLQDLAWYAQQQQRNSSLDMSIRAFTEALAGIVEFDGLDTLTDPSPRTSLTLSQYTDQKAAYVVRALQEGVVTAGQQQILPAFGAEPLHRAHDYIDKLYASEVYPPSTASSVTN